MVKITQNTELYPQSSGSNFSDVLMYFSESLLDIDNEEAILWDLAKNCISKLGFIDCVVYLLDETKNSMIQIAAYGPKNINGEEIFQPVERPIGFGIVGHVAKTGNAELIQDTSKDKRYRMDDEFRYSEVCVPIIVDGKVIGIIDCEHPEKYFFTEYHLHMLLTMSSITAIKLKSVRSRIKFQEEQKRSLDLQKQFIDLKLKAFKTQLNPHFVFNAINAIQYFITSENKKKALEYLSIFSKLIRFYLKHLEKETVDIKNEIDMLNWYLKLQKLRYQNQFDYHISIEKTSNNIEAIIPSFVIQTLFENIIEHSIFNQLKSQYIDVRFDISKNNIILTIEYLKNNSEEDITYTPEYRQQILEWQNQIQSLNTTKNYPIDKQITFEKKESKESRKIILKLPNLI